MTDTEKYFIRNVDDGEEHVTKVSISLNVYFIRNFYH